MPLKIKEASSEDTPDGEPKLFGKVEEKAIISLAFDQPDFFSAILPYLKVEYFELLEARWVFSIIKYHYDTDQVIVSRQMCKDIAAKELTADDPHEEILGLIDRESDPREVPIITRRLVDWTKQKAYGQLYSEEAISAHERGDYESIEKIVEDARKLTTINTTCHFLFNELDTFFAEENEKKLTTGFPDLDRVINEGGPIRQDVFCWMAPTGVGKSIALANNTVAAVRRKLNTLVVTMEMSFFKTGLRILGIFSEIPIRDRMKYENMIRGRMTSAKATYGAELVVVQFPPDEISVDHIHMILDTLRKIHGINIDVVVIDYLELMMSRVPANNKEEYIRQKRVSTEVCRLAVKENVLVFTASQTNRAGNENQDSKGADKVIDINKIAESYGKAMPLSYIVTINQTKQEYENGVPEDKREALKRGELADIRNTNAACRFYIVKNRNGPKFKTINARINYETYLMKESIESPKTESAVEEDE